METSQVVLLLFGFSACMLTSRVDGLRIVSPSRYEEGKCNWTIVYETEATSRFIDYNPNRRPGKPCPPCFRPKNRQWRADCTVGGASTVTCIDSSEQGCCQLKQNYGQNRTLLVRMPYLTYVRDHRCLFDGYYMKHHATQLCQLRQTFHVDCICPRGDKCPEFEDDTVNDEREKILKNLGKKEREAYLEWAKKFIWGY